MRKLIYTLLIGLTVLPLAGCEKVTCKKVDIQSGQPTQETQEFPGSECPAGWVKA